MKELKEIIKKNNYLHKGFNDDFTKFKLHTSLQDHNLLESSSLPMKVINPKKADQFDKIIKLFEKEIVELKPK